VEDLRQVLVGLIDPHAPGLRVQEGDEIVVAAEAGDDLIGGLHQLFLGQLMAGLLVHAAKAHHDPV
jgi:hypothetical protein